MREEEIKNRIAEFQEFFKNKLLKDEFEVVRFNDLSAVVAVLGYHYTVWGYKRPEDLTVYGIIDIELTEEERGRLSEIFIAILPPTNDEGEEE